MDFGFVKGSIFKIDGSGENYGVLKVGGQKEQATDYLINARIPRNNGNNTPSLLYRSILQKGIGRRFQNTSGGIYTPGCMDMDRQGRLIAADGKVNEGIALYGTPTEGLCLDNDTLSRKRNNLASQWAKDVAQFIALKETEKIVLKMNPNYTKGNPNAGLTPITTPWMHRIFEDQKIIKELIEKHGSPINLHHLPSFSNNIASFKKLFESYELKHQIYYARKANKSKSLVKQALEVGIGVDTASQKELEQSLALGGTGKNLVLTSAIKTKEQYALAIQAQVPIVLDNEDECKQAQKVAEELNKKAIVGIRISGFTVEGKKLYSRFGFDIAAVEAFILENFGEKGRFKNLSIQGFHFHLDGYSTLQRGKALSDCLTLAKRLKPAGFPIAFIDMGEGY